MEQTPDGQVNDVLEPAEQQTILFYDKPLIVVRLPSGEPGAVLRYFCDNLGLAQNRQIDRIKRKKALAAGLHYARIETAGGPQVLAVLTLRVVPGWLFGIDTNRVKPELQPEIERYQAECVDVLYQWASTPRREAPADLVPAQPIVRPEAPEQGASPQEWRLYHQRMIEFLDWQESIEAWRSSVDTRLGNLEAIVPDILQRIGPARITTEHQTLVQFYISQLHEITNKPHETLYAQLKTAFRVPRYDETPKRIGLEWSSGSGSNFQGKPCQSQQPRASSSELKWDLQPCHLRDKQFDERESWSKNLSETGNCRFQTAKGQP